MWYYHIWALLLGTVLDLLFGDPAWIPHPICGMGRMISALEKRIRRRSGTDEKKLLTGGAFLVVIMTVFWTGISAAVCFAAYRLSPYAGLLVESFLCFQLLAAKSLKAESMKVYNALLEGDLQKSRYAVSMIVGRDTENLSETGVTKAAVETVAENLSDGVIAPFLFMLIGGAPLGYFYKAVNTMDSMVGYKDEKFLYLGRWAAKLDDVCNYLPSRICALLMILACPLAGLDGRMAYKIWRRDSRNHASPNSAQTEATAAGALHVQLAGDACYFGKLYHKMTIGDDLRPVEAEDIKRINRLMVMTDAATWILTGLAAAAVWLLLQDL